MNLEDKDIKALLEAEVINSLINNKKYFGQVIHHLKKEYFSDQGSVLVFDTIKTHYLDFGSIPTLKDIILSHKSSNQQTKETLKTYIKELKDPKNSISVDQELLLKQTERFIKDAIFTVALITGAEAMGNHDHEKKMESYNLAEESVKVSLDTDFGIFVEDIDDRFDDYQTKKGIKLGIPSFDEIIGDGYTPKTLHLIAAASGVGKSAMLCSFAIQFLVQKQDVVLISLEMSETEFYKRIDSNLFDIKIKDLPNIEKQALKMKYSNMEDKIGQLVVKEFPAGGLSPLGLQSYLEKLKEEKNINNPIVMVDYLSLLTSDKLRASDNSYGYFKSVAEELRAVAQKLNIIMFTPMQMNRCLEKNTIINTIKGDKPIKNINIGDIIKSSEGNVKVVNKVKTKKQKMYKITLESGKVITVSKNHIFPTNKGEISINTGLKEGVKVASI